MNETDKTSREISVNAEDGKSGEGRRSLTAQNSKLDNMCRLHRKRRRGAAVVEFAIVAPVFFLLVFGMIEFGRMVMVQQILTNASREGARQAVLAGATATDVENVIVNYADSASISITTADVTIDPPVLGDAIANGTPVTVSVSVPFSRVSWLPSPWFLGDATLSATTVMRSEGVQ